MPGQASQPQAPKQRCSSKPGPKGRLAAPTLQAAGAAAPIGRRSHAPASCCTAKSAASNAAAAAGDCCRRRRLHRARSGSGAAASSGCSARMAEGSRTGGCHCLTGSGAAAEYKVGARRVDGKARLKMARISSEGAATLGCSRGTAAALHVSMGPSEGGVGAASCAESVLGGWASPPPCVKRVDVIACDGIA